jgi:hypothetical protein
MAYERYDTREAPRDERSRWRDERYGPRGGREERGFFERAGDEVASWFGDEGAERRRREDQRRMEHEHGFGRNQPEEGRGRFYDRGRDWDRGRFDRDDDRYRSFGSTGRERERGYRPMAGDYGRGSDQSFAGGGYGREDFGRESGSREREPYDREDFSRERGWRESEPYGRDEYRRSTYAGSPDLSREHDPHYRSWRQRHMSDLDRDYEAYRREHQDRFERDFGSWRERRMTKRGLLGQIREHMEVVGSDDQHVGTVDRTAGDRLILTKSDPDSGGVHHSLSCSDIDRVEGDRVILDVTAEQAKQRWRDESRDRALFEREDQGEMGPRMLGRSFEGTYR